MSRGLDALKEQIVRDLGGQVSKQQEIVLTNILKEYLLLESVDNFLLSLPNIVNKKRRALLLIVKDRMQLADALMRHLSVLGLKKELKPIAALTQDLEGQGLELAKPAVRQEEEESEAANDESENGNHPTDAH